MRCKTMCRSRTLRLPLKLVARFLVESPASHSELTGARYAQSVYYGLVGFPEKSMGTVSTSDSITASKETNGKASAALALDWKRACSPATAIGADE
jgi:hypothetical protein